MLALLRLSLFFFAFAAAARAEVSVQDDSGATVRLPRPAARVVSLAPHITELVYAAGAGARLVGAVEFSNYPPAARNVPLVGSFATLDLERIAALEPDLVIAWQSGNSAGQLARLRSVGLPVYVSEPHDMDDVATSLERIGILAGTAPAARAAAAAFRARKAELAARYAGRPTVRVFYEIWPQPLMTVNGKHLISDAIRLCGGENVFAGLATLAPTIGVEAVLAADPEAIVASGMADERPEWLDRWRRWPALQAAARGNLFFVPPDLLQRHTPRVLEGTARLCEQLELARGRRPAAASRP